jgi:CRISPR-associated protein Csm3
LIFGTLKEVGRLINNNERNKGKTQKKVYQVEIVSSSALHAGAGTSHSGAAITLKRNGRPYIPATTIKGIWRDNFTRLLGADAPNRCNWECDVNSGCIVCRLFGGRGFRQSKIFISDFLCVSDQNTGIIRPMVAIDRYTRKAADKSLAFCEVTESGIYKGEISVYFSEDTIEYERLLLASLEMIDSIGKNKSRGMGSVQFRFLKGVAE